MLAAVNNSGHQVTIVVKHIATIEERGSGDVLVTMIGGSKVEIQVVYVDFVKEVAKLI